MAYAIEAVRYKADGTVCAVRWHSFIFNNGLRKGTSVVVNLNDVIDAAARGHAIHICHEGGPGPLVVIVATRTGATLADMPGAPAEQSLAALPRL